MKLSRGAVLISRRIREPVYHLLSKNITYLLTKLILLIPSQNGSQQNRCPRRRLSLRSFEGED